MPASLLSPPVEPVAVPAPARREKEAAPAPVTTSPPPAVTRFTAESTLEAIPGESTTFGGETTGEELGRLFRERPELPGAMIFERDRFAGVISQAHFYRCVSRAFGREIYYRRPARIMLQDLKSVTLTLPFDCAIPAAVEQGLARPLDSIYEPFLVHWPETNRYRLCAFQDLLLASSQIAALRSRQMEQILNSVTDGLMVIDKDLRIGGEHSKAVSRLFERPHLRHIPLMEVLNPLLDPVLAGQIEEYLRVLFDPKLIDRLIKSINPAKQLVAQFADADASKPKRTKHFAFYFERIRSKSEITQVLVRVEDITQRLQHAKELEEQETAAEEKLKLVVQVLQVDSAQWLRFTEHFHRELTRMVLLVNQGEGTEPREAINQLFRQAHTLKGEASILRLSTHEQQLHKLEDQLEKLRSSPDLKSADLLVLKPHLETLQKLDEQITQSLDQLRQRHTPAPVASASPAKTDAPVIKAVSTMELLGRLIADLGERLKKPVRFHTTVADDQLPEPYRDALGEALMHLARNSMVHGIENGERRQASGKGARALIQLDLKSHPEFHEIIFQDDGAGLNLEKLRQRVQALGWKQSTEDELRSAIFEPGFSTADEVTELAGRGVGLDIIRNSLKELGGSIVPHSEAGAYCAFQILLPRKAVKP